MSDLSNVRYVVINGQKYDINGEVINSLDEIKEAAVEIDPGVANADPVVEGDTVTFRYRAGTKGAEIKKVVVGSNVYAIDQDNADPKDIKQALIDGLHPELENAEFVVSGDTMTFRFKAGTKGA
jgi:hypothetical protein